MFKIKINNSYETDPSTDSSSLSNNDLVTTKTLNTEWYIQNDSTLKEYLFPPESSNIDHTSYKLSNNHHHHYFKSNETDRPMVNSSQESDFYGFTLASIVSSVENNNVPLEIETIEEYDRIYQNDLVLANDDDTTGTTAATKFEKHQLRRRVVGTISTECGLEQTIASEEYSDQDIRCQNELSKNEQRMVDAVDECNASHLTIEPSTSSDEEYNDDEDEPPCRSYDQPETITTTNVHTLCTLDEDSNNAVDNAISTERCTIGNSSTPTDLSFNGKLKKIRSSTSANTDGERLKPQMEKDLTVAKTKTTTNNKSNLEWQLQLERSREHINEQSPDLFSEVDDFETTVNEPLNDDIVAAATSADAVLCDYDADQGVDVTVHNDSAANETDDGATTTTLMSNKYIEKTERTLNKRIQILLSSLIPPPSVTFIQHDITNLLSMYKKNIALMDVPPIIYNRDEKKTKETYDDVDDNKRISTMPNELENIEWPQIKRANAYGVHYNRTKYTENIEMMNMKLVERNVGQETASSFTFNATPNTPASKKKPMRKIMSSPGNRLSHLAKRRAIFSSANLQSQSQMAGLSKLGQKTCVIDASKLSRKEKVATPRRRALAHRRTPGRKTPSSLKKNANKQMVTVAPKFGTATRETSKRALFLSPTQEEPNHHAVGPANSTGGCGDDISRRIEGSKRALFSSPPRLLERSISNLSNASSQNSSTSFYSSMLNSGPNKATSIDRLAHFNRTNSDVSINFKRRLEPDDDNENLEPSHNRSKLQRTDQSLHYPVPATKMAKAASENSMYPNQQLSASHKQKLLWAVSTALKKKSITSTNHNFNAYASILGKVVKRLYLESLSTKTESTSGTMLRLADRLVFWVLKGKSVDEIYLEEKVRMGMTRNATKRPSGYVNRDEYLMRLEASNKLNTSTQSMGGGLTSSNNELFSNSNENLNCSISDQNRSILTNSSSKSNVGTSALRENHDSKSAQKSAQHLATSNVSFSGRNQKNLSPYNDKTRSMTNLSKQNKLLAGGTNSSILKVKRQISFDT